MPDGFRYDVFLSHSSKDKAAVVRNIAKRLRADGLRVWFDDWEIKPGDSIPEKINEGLELSRALVLFMSANAFGSPWVQLEANTFRYRDPLSTKRPSIVLRLDDAPIEGFLGQFRYIDRRAKNRKQTYAELRKACWPYPEMIEFHVNCMRLLKEAGASERTVVSGLLNEIDKLLQSGQSRQFDPERFRCGISRTISAIADQRPDYTLLARLGSRVSKCLSNNQSTHTHLSQCISRFRTSLSAALNALAANGAKNIKCGDTILLYARSESVHAAINKWLRDNPAGKIYLIFCQCVGKCVVPGDQFAHATSSARQIIYPNAHKTVALDSAVGSLIRSGHIKKVFFGAHQWKSLSSRKAWFTNTQGTLAIAALADRFGVPIFVLVETKKTQADSAQDEVDHRPPNGGDDVPTGAQYNLPIGCEPIVADMIDSKTFPFVLVTDRGEFSCADHGLRKRNRVAIDPDGFWAKKTTTDRTTARSERIVLEVLGNVDPNTVPHFRVPRLLEQRDPVWPSVFMHRKDGVRMHDLVATLHAAARRNGSEFSQKKDEFREKACKWAMSGVCTWQSPEIQESLRQGFGPIAKVYEFESRLKEAASYVWDCKSKSVPLDKTLDKEIKALASRLECRAKLFLRDANLKNQILQLIGLPGLDLPERCHTTGYFPLVDDQWFDQAIAELLLGRIPDQISWEDVHSHIWQVDFEQASRLTTPEDDFIHVLALEIFSLDYNTIVDTITEQLPGVLPEHVHETMLFRCFRAWARRLFYYRERPESFATRYRHESLAHYHGLAQTAAEQLQQSLGGKLTSFIQHA